VTPLVGAVCAGGQTGRAILAELSRRGIRARGLVHSTRSAQCATEAGADETALLQLADQSSWAPAIEGLDTLVFLAPPFAAEEERFAANALVASPGCRTTCANRP
jgi:uncharacterized protein YbjT (DUF2867 family)